MPDLNKRDFSQKKKKKKKSKDIIKPIDVEPESRSQYSLIFAVISSVRGRVRCEGKDDIMHRITLRRRHWSNLSITLYNI